MTEKLYYSDSHIKCFDAVVVSCARSDRGWAVLLDRTAFFPEGGGQSGDTGTLNGIKVLDTREEDGQPVHFLSSPLDPGAEVHGVLDWDARFRRMQNHSGEHIVSGLVYREYGYKNVGFHMGSEGVIIDFDGELDRAGLEHIEHLANIAVSENRTVKAWFPSPASLRRIKYRSKLELSENVRLVRIDGYDICACCAPHVKRSGEIGIIKLLDFSRHRGGTRLQMLCGFDALDDYRMRYASTAAVSAMLSAKQSQISDYVRSTLDELSQSKQENIRLMRLLLDNKIAALQPSPANICIFDNELDAVGLRELVNAGMKICGGVCAAFSGREGEWRYIIGSAGVDLKKHAGAINAAISGRGGGRKEMIQGSACAAKTAIEEYFNKTVFI